MAGIIDINMNRDPNKIAGYDPEKIQLKPEDTMEHRIQGIIQKNSPLMQMAQTQGLQSANRRGLLNSSIAVGEAQKAVIGAALPIASQDASTSFQANTLNQQAGNEALRFSVAGAQNIQAIGAQGEQQRGLSAQEYTQTKDLNEQTTKAQLDRDILTHRQTLEQARAAGDIQLERDVKLQLFNLESMNKQFENARTLDSIRMAHETTMKNLDLDQQKQLAGIEQSFRTELQNSASATNFYGMAMQTIAQIGANPDLNPAQRQAGINQQVEMLRAGLDLVGHASAQEFPFYTSPASRADAQKQEAKDWRFKKTDFYNGYMKDMATGKRLSEDELEAAGWVEVGNTGEWEPSR